MYVFNKDRVFQPFYNEDSIMNKGMFYLLPFLVFTPVAASNALPTVEVAKLLNVLEQVRVADKPKVIITVPKPISGRNMQGRRMIKVIEPRAGRNNPKRFRNSIKLKLIKRK